MWERSAQTVLSVGCTALVLISGVAQAHTPGSVSCDGKKVAAADVQTKLGPEVAETIEFWQDWVNAHGYRFEVADEGRAILVVDAQRKSLSRSRKVVRKVGRWFDEVLPRSVAPATVETDLAGTATDGEDVDEALEATLAAAELPKVPVVFALEEKSDYTALLDHLVELEPYLRDWAAHDRESAAGFTLARPLVTGWLESGPGREEWSAENELAHRLAHMLLVQRYGRLPFWLLTGLSWQVEQKVTGDLYCFPYRSSFVGRVEHGGWKAELRTAYKKRKEPAQHVRFDEISAWERGRFVEDEVAHAWGTSRFLVERCQDRLPEILADLSVHRAEHEVETFDDGSWRLIPGFEVSSVDQESIFERHLGSGFRGELTEFFRKGR